MAPTTAGEFWTLVAGIGTILLTVAAYRGLRALRLTKTDMLTRAERDARESAVARCKEFATDIIPQNAVILRELAISKTPVFVTAGDEVRFDPDNDGDLTRAKAWRDKLPEGLAHASVRFCNSLEAWAMHFTHGLADHKVAFDPCALGFCRMVMQHYAVLLILRANNSSGKFPNLVKLFKGWIEDLENAKRSMKHGELLRQLMETQTHGPPSNPLPSPLGTKL